MAIRLVALCINCGFAHTGIRELTSCTRLSNKQIDKEKQASEFKELFAQCPKYGLNESYFDSSGRSSSLLIVIARKWGRIFQEVGT